MFSLCDSHGWASGGWPSTNALINGRHTLERLSSCGELSTVVAAVVIMDQSGSGSQGVGKKVSLITGLGSGLYVAVSSDSHCRNTFSMHINNIPPLFLGNISSQFFC